MPASRPATNSLGSLPSGTAGGTRAHYHRHRLLLLLWSRMSQQTPPNPSSSNADAFFERVQALCVYKGWHECLTHMGMASWPKTQRHMFCVDSPRTKTRLFGIMDAGPGVRPTVWYVVHPADFDTIPLLGDAPREWAPFRRDDTLEQALAFAHHELRNELGC
jgi:hypothetical protein